jgi:hypothetical protein
MSSVLSQIGMLCVLALVLVVSGCGTLTPEADVQTSPLTRHSPLPTAPLLPTTSPVPVFTPATALTPALIPEPAPGPGQLVVLHTNNNSGETEPCG